MPGMGGRRSFLPYRWRINLSSAAMLLVSAYNVVNDDRAYVAAPGRIMAAVASHIGA